MESATRTGPEKLQRQRQRKLQGMSAADMFMKRGRLGSDEDLFSDDDMDWALQDKKSMKSSSSCSSPGSTKGMIKPTTSKIGSDDVDWFSEVESDMDSSAKREDEPKEKKKKKSRKSTKEKKAKKEKKEKRKSRDKSDKNDKKDKSKRKSRSKKHSPNDESISPMDPFAIEVDGDHFERSEDFFQTSFSDDVFASPFPPATDSAIEIPKSRIQTSIEGLQIGARHGRTEKSCRSMGSTATRTTVATDLDLSEATPDNHCAVDLRIKQRTSSDRVNTRVREPASPAPTQPQRLKAVVRSTSTSQLVPNTPTSVRSKRGKRTVKISPKDRNKLGMLAATMPDKPTSKRACASLSGRVLSRDRSLAALFQPSLRPKAHSQSLNGNLSHGNLENLFQTQAEPSSPTQDRSLLFECGEDRMRQRKAKLADPNAFLDDVFSGSRRSQLTARGITKTKSSRSMTARKEKSSRGRGRTSAIVGPMFEQRDGVVVKKKPTRRRSVSIGRRLLGSSHHRRAPSDKKGALFSKLD